MADDTEPAFSLNRAQRRAMYRQHRKAAAVRQERNTPGSAKPAASAARRARPADAKR